MEKRERERKWVAGLSGSFAGSVAEFTTLPVDTVKVRMQITTTKGGTTLKRVVSEIFEKEGSQGFFKGLTPAIWRQMIYQGVKMLIYEPIRDFAFDKFGAKDTQSKGDDLLIRLMVGGTSGAIGTFISTPTDVTKVRMQADMDGSRYRNFRHAITHITKTEGVFAFWKGVNANIQRSFIVNACELATYDTSKDILCSDYNWDKNKVTTHAVCALNAGLVAAVASTPVDLAKTRLMNAGDGRAMYRGMFHCLTSTARNEGIFALYKGFFPNWFRLAPWTLMFFLSYERIRFGLSAVDETMQQSGW